MEAAEVNVIVHSARGLRGKKKDRHKYSVIFGSGNKKFRTGVVVEPSGNPVWNEESTVPIEKGKPIKFKVTEKEDILGQVIVPIDEISLTRSFTTHTCDLRPHRKCPKPEGQLVIECWVTKQQEPSHPKTRGSTESLNRIKASPFTKLKTRLSASPLVSNKLSKKGAKLSPGQRATQSMYDISSAPKKDGFSLERNVVFGDIDLDDSDDDGHFVRNSPLRMSVTSSGKVSVNSDVIPETIEESPVKKLLKDQPVEKESTNPFDMPADESPVHKKNILESPANKRKTVESPSPKKRSASLIETALKQKTDDKPVIHVEGKKPKPEATKEIVAEKRKSTFYNVDETDLIDEISHDTQTPALNVNPLPSKVMAVKPLLASPKLNKKSSSHTDLTKVAAPEITGISPKEGPIEGGTRLTIRGMNLGLDHHDVVGLFVCGANCVGTLEFESPRKINCVTKQWKACVGNIDIETRSGGRGTSLVQFTFVDTSPPIERSDSVNSSPASIRGKGHKREPSTGSIGKRSFPPSPALDRKPSPAVERKMSLEGKPPPVPASKPPDHKRESPGVDRKATERKEHQKTDSEGSWKDFNVEPPTESFQKSGPSILSLIPGSDSVETVSSRSRHTQHRAPDPTLEEKNQEISQLQAELVQAQKMYQAVTMENKGLLAANKDLKEDNQDLQIENEKLRLYIDRLLAKVIVKCPDTLCVDSTMGRGAVSYT